MMRVDFYQLSKDPVERVLPSLAQRTLDSGKRLLVVAEETELRQRISEALWGHGKTSFLAHGDASEPKAEHQPILLSPEPEPLNQAAFVALADGRWRDAVADRFERVFLLFDSEATPAARETWRALADRPEATCHYWRQEGGKWIEGARRG